MTMYRKILLTVLISLVTTWTIGGVIGSHKVKKAAVLGMVLLAGAAALIWVLVGIPPVPRSVMRPIARLFR